jgi:hypothetical protein
MVIMNAKYLVVAMMGLGFSATGCMQTASDEDLAAMDLEAYQYEPQDNPTGSGTNNHLGGDIYEGNKYLLLSAMSYSLATPFSFNGVTTYLHSVSNNVVNTGLLDTSGGRDLFKVAVECALADGQYVQQNFDGFLTTYYTGKGLMSTTAGWYSGGLTTEQKEDVLRCVIARVNYLGATVPLVVSGQNVTVKTSEFASHEGYEPDALWDVNISTSPVTGLPLIQEYAWPMMELALPSGESETCISTVDIINTRLCSQETSMCGFQVYDTRASDCVDVGPVGGPSVYQCNHDDNQAGRPVVQSWVQPGQLTYIYNRCQ